VPTDGLRRPDGSPYAITPLKKLVGQNVLWIGPGGGNFFTDKELDALDALDTRLPDGKTLGRPVFGIAENVVAIFALGPISETTARLVSNELRTDPIGGPPPPPPTPLPLRREPGAVTELNVTTPPDVFATTLAVQLSTSENGEISYGRLENLILVRFICSVPLVVAEGEFEFDVCATLNDQGITMKLKDCTLEGPELLNRLQADVVLNAALRVRLTTTGRAQEFKAVLCFGQDGKILPAECQKSVLNVRR